MFNVQQGIFNRELISKIKNNSLLNMAFQLNIDASPDQARQSLALQHWNFKVNN